MNKNQQVSNWKLMIREPIGAFLVRSFVCMLFAMSLGGLIFSLTGIASPKMWIMFVVQFILQIGFLYRSYEVTEYFKKHYSRKV